MTNRVFNTITLTLSLMMVVFAVATPFVQVKAQSGLTLTPTLTLDSQDGDTSSFGFTDPSDLTVVSDSETHTASCDIWVDTDEVEYNGAVTVSWDTNGFDTITINGEPVSGDTGSRTYENITENTIFKLIATGDGTACESSVSVSCLPPAELQCELSATPLTIYRGEKSVLSWNTFDATAAVIDRGVGDVDLGTHSADVFPSETTTYTLTVTDGEQEVQCPITIEVLEKPPVEECELEISKSADVTTAVPGDEITYTLSIKNTGGADCTGGGVLIHDEIESGLQFVSATQSDNLSAGYESDPLYSESERVVRFNGHILTPGEVGSMSIVAQVTEPTQCGDYQVENQVKATALELDNFATWVYSENVIVDITNPCDTPQPQCTLFTVTPNNFTNGTGGEVTLVWETVNADTVSINNDIGEVAGSDTLTRLVNSSTVFTLTATGAGTEVSCEAPVTITDTPVETVPRCDFLRAADSVVLVGTETRLEWETTNATEVEINNGVGAVSADGATTVTVDTDTTYTLTARNADGVTDQCDVLVQTENPSGGGGGGGGSSSPRCELTASDKSVAAGEAVTLTWDNVRTNEMVLEDNRGNVIIDTEDDSTIDEDEGSVIVRPTRDTQYIMTVTRGIRERVCRVNIEIEDNVTVIESRNQEPQVAGIALTQVPYTGFEAGPIMTFIFYAVLAVWAAFVAYLLVVREQTVAGVSLSSSTRSNKNDSWEDIVDQIHESLETDFSDTAEPVVAATAAPVMSPKAAAPSNLPVGEMPVFGYAALSEVTEPIEETVIDPMTELENAAHASQALLSSDAIKYFMDTYPTTDDRVAALKKIIDQAKAQYPTEGGWMVLNIDRVTELTKVDAVAEPTHFAPDTRVGASSLAEAIVSGNIAAAYELIGNRPMFALADAAADLDAIYRTRKGMEASVSEILKEKTTSLDDAQIESMIKMLTSALDGAYDDEAAAVKMAIMKAVKVAG